MKRQKRRKPAKQSGRKSPKPQRRANRPVPISAAAVEQDFQAGVQFHRAGEMDRAAALYESVLAKCPDHGDSLNLLGLISMERGEHERARLLFQNLIQIDPKNANGYNNLGGVFKDLGEFEQARAQFGRALELQPDMAEAHYNLAGLYRRENDLAAAAAAYEKALELRAGYYEACVNLGDIYWKQDRLAEAIEVTRRGLKLAPDCAEAHNNLGTYLNDISRFEDGLASFDAALRLDPTSIEGKWNRAYCFLGRGLLEEGWKTYEYRVLRPESRRIGVPYDEWDGGPLDGKTILARAEQGIGDEVLFATCLPDLIEIAGHCVIECDPRLEPLYKRSFPEASVFGVSRNDTSWLQTAPKIDLCIRVGGLLRYLRPDIESFPDRTGMLRPKPELRDSFARYLRDMGPEPKVGISWRSMRKRANRHYASLDQWGPVLRTPGVRFVNLQYDESVDEIAAAAERFGVEIHNFEGLNLRDDLDGVSALVAALDLVIAPNNLVYALAAALGIETWAMSLKGSWWTLGTNEDHWLRSRSYTSDPENPDWGSVLDEIARDLRAFLERRNAASPQTSDAA